MLSEQDQPQFWPKTRRKMLGPVRNAIWPNQGHDDLNDELISRGASDGAR